MEAEPTSQTLEEKYIEKSSKLFENADGNRIEEITKAINLVSYSVCTILKSPLFPEQKNHMLSGVVNLVSSDLRNNPEFRANLEEFISEKSKNIRALTNKNTENLLTESDSEINLG